MVPDQIPCRPDTARDRGIPDRRPRHRQTGFDDPLPGGDVRRRDCAGIAGAYLSLVQTPMWVEGMSAGKGWIALALVVFGTWKPARVVLGAYLFGGVTQFQLFAQGFGLPIPTEFLSMLPYAATVIVLVIICRDPKTILLNQPASLGHQLSFGRMRPRGNSVLHQQFSTSNITKR
jgi:hypothetical protein